MIALLLWLLVPITNAVLDWYIIERLKKPIDHLVEFIFRGFAAILYGAFVFDAQGGNHGAVVIAYEVTSFYLIFELLLNLLRWKPADYLGKSSQLDIFLSRYRPLYWTLKIFSLAGAILSAIYLINYGRL